MITNIFDFHEKSLKCFNLATLKKCPIIYPGVKGRIRILPFQVVPNPDKISPEPQHCPVTLCCFASRLVFPTHILRLKNRGRARWRGVVYSTADPTIFSQAKQKTDSLQNAGHATHFSGKFVKLFFSVLATEGKRGRQTGKSERGGEGWCTVIFLGEDFSSFLSRTPEFVICDHDADGGPPHAT